MFKLSANIPKFLPKALVAILNWSFKLVLKISSILLVSLMPSSTASKNVVTLSFLSAILSIKLERFIKLSANKSENPLASLNLPARFKILFPTVTVA